LLWNSDWHVTNHFTFTANNNTPTHSAPTITPHFVLHVSEWQIETKQMYKFHPLYPAAIRHIVIEYQEILTFI
jgi:hypothetical protein